MNISFDPSKDASNLVKHGVSLSLAMQLDWDSLLAIQDTRKDYGEDRMIGFAPIDGRLYCVIYTEREQSRRIISLRKTNDKEKAFYVSHYEIG